MSRRPADGPAGASDAKMPKAEGTFDIAAIRAQLAAKKAALQKGGNSASASPTPPPAAAPGPPRPVGPASLPPPATMDTSIAERLAAARAKVEAMKARTSNPYLSGSGSMPKAPEPKQSFTAPTTNSSIALHPLLMTETQQREAQEKNEKKRERDRYKTMAPKFSTVRANQAVAPPPTKLAPAAPAPSLNPYASTSTSNSPAPEDGGGASTRRSRKMKFSAPGKYISQGDAARNEAKMEALKQRIAEASRKAGLDSEFDSLEKSLKRQPPPEVEWWDQAILPPGSNYDDIENAVKWIATDEKSLVTHLIQHPIPIPAPGDKKQPERGLMLTKKEQKKMRRQRRKAELEDKRDRQKMGLIPPDPPKVRLANLMKVLTSDAVADPTKVEARVRKEVDQRRIKHENDNEERKLTAEEKKQKEYDQLAARERKGIYGAAFKIKYLTNGRHKFKVRETAKKDLLSGVCIFHPSFALVLVEGTDKGIKHYRQLMENRIDWTEEARPLGDEDDDEENGDKAKAPDDVKAPDSLVDNKCELIWTGEVPERTFKMFRARHAETDTKAKEWLTNRYEGYWDLAKRHIWSGDDL